ncbi:tyrosine-type recombinase/integrase [Rhizorhabdus wittichii]|uniref:Tyrosine-type recombinase/integrase n=2 Tax=Rhizorhabdus wittichii TaxID=160791 RepID=A0A975CYH0_9SPHN|nr:tyrosine-type recombinase/integrase [Rhizorhabdus wittichii]
MNRPLPPNVNAVPDRHGKIRYRYRRSGVTGGYLPGAPWSVEWLEKLAEFQGQEAAPKIRAVSPAKKLVPYSMDQLASLLRGTLRWKSQAADTQRVYGRMIDRLLDETNHKGIRFGARDARQITVASLEKLLARYADRPGAAKKMRDVLKRLFKTAVKHSWRRDNPAAETDAIPQRGDGHHTWTDAEIEQYRAKHAYGTTARLVLELALNTAARRCNLATLERSAIIDGHIAVDHVKDGEPTLVELTAEARLALEKRPSTHIRYLIANAYGKPYTKNGFGNRMKEWADAAGLPAGRTLHGLRKARSRQLAEAGATNAEGRAITGHKTDAMFNHYAAKANRTRLAGQAMAKLRGDISGGAE